MRKTIHKWFWAWDFDKEETWLNELAAKGLGLVAVGFCKYTFEDCTPGEYTVRLELLENVPTHIESQQYIKFLEDTGAEYLGAVMRWVYLRKKTAGEPFHLYSDSSSRILHLNRILVLIGVAGGLNLFAGLSSIARYFEAQRSGSLVGVLNLCLGLLIARGFLLVFLKRRSLKKQQQLFE